MNTNENLHSFTIFLILCFVIITTESFVSLTTLYSLSPHYREHFVQYLSLFLVVSGDFDVLFKCCFVMFIYYTIVL